MKIIDLNDQLQNEALLNEYKGNLFEYLLGHFLARNLHIESNFLLNLNSEYKERLSMYEEFIRLNFPELIAQLSDMALKSAAELCNYLKAEKHIVNNIFIIGKTVATNDNSLWGETDLVLVTETEKLKFSLKLAKDHSYTNTKSAGVKSFIVKYFASFSDAKLDQISFSHLIDFQFNKMGEALHSLEGLSFNGRFTSEWTEQFTELPGELASEHREIVFKNYAAVNLGLYQVIKKYFELDKIKFVKCLLPLLGLSDPDIIQVTTFHKNHQFFDLKIFTIRDLALYDLDIILMELKPNSHYFEIKIKNTLLQIRIKPMNKFTTASYKVNCSVKGINE